MPACADSNDMSPIVPGIWFPVGGTVWVGLGGAVALKADLQVSKATHHSQFPLSDSCLQMKV